jgi:hypothetical protein
MCAWFKFVGVDHKYIHLKQLELMFLLLIKFKELTSDWIISNKLVFDWSIEEILSNQDLPLLLPHHQWLFLSTHILLSRQPQGRANTDHF